MIEVYSPLGIWHVFLYSIDTNIYHFQSMKYRQYALIPQSTYTFTSVFLVYRIDHKNKMFVAVPWQVPVFGFKTLLQQGISEPIFYGDLVYKFKRIFGKPNFSDQFKKIVKRWIRVGYNLDIMRQSACLVFNPITVYILTSTKNASLIITDFLAMIYKNEQPHTASLCRGWMTLENDFNFICRWSVIPMTSYRLNVHMTALCINPLWFQFEFAPILCRKYFANQWTNFGSCFQTFVLASNKFMRLWRHIKDKIKGPFTKLANILILL